MQCPPWDLTEMPLCQENKSKNINFTGMCHASDAMRKLLGESYWEIGQI